MKKIIVIGAGFAGLSAAISLASQHFEIILLEKNNSPGGRARSFSEAGFTFDMGPSWYWMPEIFEDFFKKSGKSTKDFYELVRLNPSYQVVFDKDNFMEVPAEIENLENLFELHETGGGEKLKLFLKQAAYKYKTGMGDFVWKPSISIFEYLKLSYFFDALRLQIFKPFSKHIRHFFKNKILLQLLEFPILFLGALPENTPALYSLMNYADMVLGTWYPIGGMHQIIIAMVTIAEEKGVTILYNQEVKFVEIIDGKIKKVNTSSEIFDADVVINAGDYHHFETNILSPKYRSYNKNYWESRVLAPSALIFYLGLNKKVEKLLHHNLFFDTDFAIHAREIYEIPKWPENPLFYVSVPSKTDRSVAPEGCENLFILVPVATGLTDTNETREKYYNIVMKRLEVLTGQNIIGSVIFKRSFAINDFKNDYHSFKGNAYGLANTLFQTAILKPSIKSKKVKNLFHTGQLTVPGPGVPPSIISGEVVAKEVLKNLKNNK